MADIRTANVVEGSESGRDVQVSGCETHCGVMNVGESGSGCGSGGGAGAIRCDGASGCGSVSACRLYV